MDAVTRSFVVLVLVLLSASTNPAIAAKECSPSVSRVVKNALDDKMLFKSCSAANANSGANITSLSDVLNLSERDFLTFCRTPNCIKPVETLLHSIPSPCRNLTEEVSTAASKCTAVTKAADKQDEEYMYK
ncbi:hypothetical protein PHYSODRAFT_478618 [Phytophthora sojae]|uniref:Elicitin n=1 Tax=Phytophthora sojae (strain P6497) TaxID=1094619 RepID=G4YSE9_PHYSP|nr:hypothetical protein PHYSODRAFT_478618 [Phytophthora sojae]EGZ22965.1 hypothetical protein PHYSODRAFT_478618 [Phytophthora sojae]|eukprot:XP_009518253.1 hypothetical protein PHYSODRAFT_478618 [Phytophthora sojae]